MEKLAVSAHNREITWSRLALDTLMTSKTLCAFPLLFLFASAATGSTMLARMERDTYIGTSAPPLHSSANFAFAVFPPGDPVQNAWQLGPLSVANVGQTISVTPETALAFPPLDWSLLTTRLTNSQGDAAWLGLGSPTAPVTSFQGRFLPDFFPGVHTPTSVAEAFVPSLNGYDFNGYRFDRFDFILHSLGFRHDAGFYWIDAHFEVQMFGGVVPEPATLMMAAMAVVAIGSTARAESRSRRRGAAAW